MEEANQIFDYLPYYSRNKGQQDYLDFLYQSYEINYSNENYSFAFLAFHLLFMSSIYTYLWKIKCCKQRDFENALIGYASRSNKVLNEEIDWFIFRKFSEKQVLGFLKLLDFNNDEIKSLEDIVDLRNKVAHPNGNIVFRDQISLDHQIFEILNHLDNIQKSCCEMLDNLIIDFLTTSWDTELSEYDNYEDEITEVLIRSNCLSRADINFINSFDISLLNDNPHFSEIAQLFFTIQEIYGEG